MAAVLARDAGGDAGYFVPVRRYAEKGWLVYDDENVYEISEEEVTGAKSNAEGLRPVLHFYERMDEVASGPTLA
jgi:hypothetical protein